MKPVAKEVLNNHELQREYEVREKAWRDEQSRINTVKEDVIINGLKLEVEHDIIAQMVEVPLSKVEEMAQKRKK